MRVWRLVPMVLVCWLVVLPLWVGPALAQQEQIPPIEYLSLILLYESTSGRDWWYSEGWLQNEMPCSWYGVHCEGGHVVGIDLHLNELTGGLPSELGNLTYLRSLILDNNYLSGAIPPELGNLEHLEYLWLYENELSGAIPAELGNLHNLRELQLGRNQLSGRIPRELGDLGNLVGLWLYGNQLSGEIPPELSQLRSLVGLYLYENQLNGPLPWELGNLASLHYLHIDANALRGALPHGVTRLSLSTFWYSDTGLCDPVDPIFQQWLRRIPIVASTGDLCDTASLPIVMR